MKFSACCEHRTKKCHKLFPYTCTFILALHTSMAQRIPAIRQNRPLIAIKIRRVTARQPEGVQCKRATVHSGR